MAIRKYNKDTSGIANGRRHPMDRIMTTEQHKVSGFEAEGVRFVGTRENTCYSIVGHVTGIGIADSSDVLELCSGVRSLQQHSDCEW